MLKVDTSNLPSTSWAKVQALTSFIQLKSGNSSSSPPFDPSTSFVSHSDAGNNLSKPNRLKIFIGTWNMYGRLLPIDLEPFLTTRPSTINANQRCAKTLQPDSNNILVEHDCQNGGIPFLDSSTTHPYHLLAIGTQECERDISESLFYPSKEVWEQRLSDYLGEHYQLLRCETLAALHLAVFVWKPVASYVKNIHSADIKTGWANMVGNKGAVAVSLDFGSQSFLFINCHLRAHQTKLAERNANVHRILHELQIKGGKSTCTHTSPTTFHLSSLKRFSRSSKIKKKDNHDTTKTTNQCNNDTTSSKQKSNASSTIPVNKSSSASALSSSSSTESQHSVTEQFDHVFIFGDTNYRINAERQFVLDTIQKRDFATLLKYDQLSVERQLGTTPLASFKEHPINFIPTYKFDALETVATSDSSSSSLPSPSSATRLNHLHQQLPSSPSSSSSPLSPITTPATSTPVITATTTAASSSSSSSLSFVITPTDSIGSSGSVSIRYDTSPKQRVPSWTDRILWHDHHQLVNDGATTNQTPFIRSSGPTLTSLSTTATNAQQTKPKLGLKWISALKRKNKNGFEDLTYTDKNTICYHYDTVMDPRLMGASDHLPVIGIFGVWFDDWETGKRARSIKSTKKKKAARWKLWI
ncbi:Endonuclease/exonuclease/phosphatase [Halteromyces radiatus]|uniref:Endonuclease/exonuclease/phosphatase n=1 Tax=Halteromyces radiatus TaxID=101107 RepID=UPI00221F3645|nr:Endonuclease/exonuclease/phosphatase [Halteromyces radiatus]KAI8086591.1 Endonuclease/exonuclease/phosphatase [Halteromyces radiatus]